MVETDLREVAFLGRITAAFTHEMKNVLAIIKESAGLMEDLLALSQEAAFPHRDRFARCLSDDCRRRRSGASNYPTGSTALPTALTKMSPPSI